MSRSGKKSVRQRANEIRFSYIISHYLRECYATRTPARVATLARLLGGNRPTLSRTITQYLGKPLKTDARTAGQTGRAAASIDQPAPLRGCGAERIRRPHHASSRHSVRVRRLTHRVPRAVSKIGNRLQQPPAHWTARWYCLRHSVGTTEMPQVTLPELTPAFRARLPLNEQLMDVFADALVSVNDALEIAAGASGKPAIVAVRPRIQAVYDELNSLMKELAD